MGEQLILQAQRMTAAHPIGKTVIGPTLDPGLHEGAIEAEVDFGEAGDGSEFALVFVVVATKRANVVKGASFEAHQVVAADEIGRGIGFRLWNHHGLVETGRQNVDEIDVAGELVMLLLSDGGRDEDAEMTDRVVNGINNGLPMRAYVVDRVIEVEYPVQSLLRWRN